VAGISWSQADSLRERKKALTRGRLEETALRMFLEQGYDQVRLEDICADALVSMRTFFRYFGSKEDLVLGRLRAHLALAERLFDSRPADERLADSVRAVIDQVAEDYVREPERELTRLRLVTTTPALETGILNVFAGFERLVRDFAATRMTASRDARHARLLAAATVSAFRIGLEVWVDRNGKPGLPRIVAENLSILASGTAEMAAAG
jgi:TetR/AcrR family transcriptional regulator, regulator of mycofactocin system